jgi:multicomponent K+:H+ antiporter subunit D
MSGAMGHLVIAPIVLPLAAAALVVMIEQRPLRVALSLAATVALLLISVTLLLSVSAPDGMAASVYRLGDWPAPFGIVLVLDRLSAMMVTLASLLALAALVFSMARWDQAGPRFHALFLLLLAGLNGAFLTGDLFNLFVFFEVLLAASYGLLLHGSGVPRVKAGLHYIAVNLGASSLFLLGVAVIYGITGTLNMADLAQRIPQIAGAERALFEIGCAVLSVAFLIKAGAWPLGFWLPPTYSAASAPAAALFAIMTKVGVYATLRATFLFFGPDAGHQSAGLASPILLFGGGLTIAMSAIGMLAARSFSRIAGFAVLTSSGAVLAVIGAGGERALSGALYYMISSTLAVGAFLLLIELLNRARGTTAPALGPPVFDDEYRDPYDDGPPSDEVGVIIPLAIALISGGFILCALLLAGMPPLAGFVGKFAIMTGLAETGAAAGWTLIVLLTLSSFAALVALLRTGVEAIWAPAERTIPRVRGVEFAAIAGLLVACIVLTTHGQWVLDYTDGAVAWLERSQDYVSSVLGADSAAETAAEVEP